MLPSQMPPSTKLPLTLSSPRLREPTSNLVCNHLGRNLKHLLTCVGYRRPRRSPNKRSAYKHLRVPWSRQDWKCCRRRFNSHRSFEEAQGGRKSFPETPRGGLGQRTCWYFRFPQRTIISNSRLTHAVSGDNESEILKLLQTPPKA